MTTEATVVFVVVVGLRFILPLFIPRWPLPAVLACLVLDGIDQSVFQAFGFDPPGYQNYDKAMDLFYLSIAFLASLQNWTRSSAVGISRFLFFYRMVGVMRVRGHRGAHAAADLPEHLRVLLHRLRGGAAALGPAPVRHALLGRDGRLHLDLRQAAAGVLDPRGPARLHRHLAGRAVVPAARHRGGRSSGWRSSGSSCGRACCRPTGRWRVAADPLPEEMDTAAERDAWTAAHVRVLVVVDAREGRAHRPAVDDLRAHPARARGVRPADVRRHRGLRRRSTPRSPSPSPAGPARREGLAADFGVRVVVNLGLVLLARLLLGAQRARPVGDALLRAAASRCSSPCTTGSPRWRRCAPSTTPPTRSRPRRLDTGSLTFARERLPCEGEGCRTGRESWDGGGQIWAVASWPSSSGARRSMRRPPEQRPRA